MNGTNFVRANRQLSEDIQTIKTTDEDQRSSSPIYIWEGRGRMVKSVKPAMVAVFTVRCNDVFDTIILEAERTVNSRPLIHIRTLGNSRSRSAHPELMFPVRFKRHKSAYAVDQSVRRKKNRGRFLAQMGIEVFAEANKEDEAAPEREAVGA